MIPSPAQPDLFSQSVVISRPRTLPVLDPEVDPLIIVIGDHPLMLVRMVVVVMKLRRRLRWRVPPGRLDVAVGVVPGLGADRVRHGDEAVPLDVDLTLTLARGGAGPGAALLPAPARLGRRWLDVDGDNVGRLGPGGRRGRQGYLDGRRWWWGRRRRGRLPRGWRR